MQATSVGTAREAGAPDVGLLMRDLSTGGVIRQERETTRDGRFVRRRSSGASTAALETTFDDSRCHVLTEPGRQFVHYTLGAELSTF